MKDKFLLIGASGFAGIRLIEEIGERYEVKNLDKQPSRFYPGITTLGDVRDKAMLAKELAGQDAVVLLAAEHRDDYSFRATRYPV